MSAKMAICGPAEPITAGPSALKNWRTSGPSRGRTRRSSTPSRRAAHTMRASCATPDTVTPTLAATPDVGEQPADAQEQHHDEVQQHGREGGGGELAVGVERARLERHQHHAEQVGEGDPRHQDGVVEPRGLGIEAWREQAHQRRREDLGDHQHDGLAQQQDREDLAGELARRRRAPPLQHAGIGRHVGRVEGALAEDGAELVGQAEGDEEGIRHGAGAQQRTQRHVAQEARAARHQGQSADGEQVSVHPGPCPRASVAARPPS